MQPSCCVSETFAGPGSQTLLAAASRLIMQTGVNRGQLTAIRTVVALPVATAGLAAKRYLVRALTLGAVTRGEGESV
jgi:multiple sugar transport system permease protein